MYAHFCTGRAATQLCGAVQAALGLVSGRCAGPGWWGWALLQPAEGELPREAAERATAAAGHSATQNGWAGGWRTGRKDFLGSPVIYSGIVKSDVFTGEKAVWKRGRE